MNWSDANWANATYFTAAAAALREGTFEDLEDGRPRLMQIGVNITERVDLILKDPEFFGNGVVTAAMKTLTLVAELHPEEFRHHIRCSIGFFDYAGLFDVSQRVVRKFWSNHFRRTKPQRGTWADHLKRAMSDASVASKLKTYVIITQRGESRSQALQVIDQDYRGLGWFRFKPASYHIARIVEPDLPAHEMQKFGS